MTPGEEGQLQREILARQREERAAANNGSGGTTEVRPVAPQPDRAAITEHVTRLHELAKATGAAGKLVLASYGEDPATGRDIVAKVEHVAIGDVAGMVKQAIAWTIEEHRNVYTPLCIMRPDLPPGKKGGESDIVCVLGLTGDFDDADAANWKARSLLPPSCVLETSPGRIQSFVWLDPAKPLSLAEAKALAIRMQEHAHCDFGAKDLSHVWRLDGSLNWPNRKKAKAGRSRVPHLVVTVPGGTGKPVDPSALSAVLTPVSTAPVTRTSGPSEPHQGRGAMLPRKTRLTPPDPIPESLKDEMEGRSKETDHSKLFFRVVNELYRLGYTDTAIVQMLAHNAFVTPERYHDRMLTEVRASIQNGIDPQIAAINTRFAEVIDHGQAVYVNEGRDPRTGTNETYVLSLPQLRDRLVNEPIPKHDKTGKRVADNIAEVWRRDPHHCCHEDGFDMKPDGTPATVYNMWRGYGVQPNPTGDDSRIVQFLRDVIGQGVERIFQLVINLFAFLVQNPGAPWTVALILAGGQGVGKTTLAMIFKRIYGAHYRTENTLEDLFVTFNSGLLSKIFISVEEGSGGGRADLWARLKPFITRLDLSINEKYRPAITVPNTAHVLVTTNKPELLKIDHDDRRFWILTIKDVWTKAQFKELYAQIAEGSACGRFLYRLQHHPIGDFDPQRDRPLTTALADSKERSFAPEEAVVREWLQDSRFGSLGSFGPDGLLINKKVTHEAYEQKMERTYRREKPLGRNTWYSRLKDMLAGAISEPTKQPDQERQFHIAPIDEARAAFNRYARQELEWEEHAAASPPVSPLPQRVEDLFE